MTAQRYHVTTRLNDRTIEFQAPVDDPFIRQTVYLSGWDMIRGLPSRLDVTVIVGGDPAAIDAVLAMEGSS